VGQQSRRARAQVEVRWDVGVLADLLDHAGRPLPEANFIARSMNWNAICSG
jgi:hypothetical protein